MLYPSQLPLKFLYMSGAHAGGSDSCINFSDLVCLTALRT